MTQRRGFYRKLGYILAIAVLCFPVYELGHPASVDTNGHRAPAVIWPSCVMMKNIELAKRV